MGSNKTTKELALKRIEVQPGITIQQLAIALKVEPNKLYRVMPKLVSDGLIEREGEGWYLSDYDGPIAEQTTTWKELIVDIDRWANEISDDIFEKAEFLEEAQNEKGDRFIEPFAAARDLRQAEALIRNVIGHLAPLTLPTRILEAGDQMTICVICGEVFVDDDDKMFGFVVPAGMELDPSEHMIAFHPRCADSAAERYPNLNEWPSDTPDENPGSAED